MEEAFDLEVLLNGQELVYEAKLLVQGYTYKFHVLIDGQPILFEPDEEGSYRARVEPTEETTKAVSPELLQVIIRKLESISE